MSRYLLGRRRFYQPSTISQGIAGNLVVLGENWEAETGTIPENPSTASISSNKVAGWNYGSETLPLVSYRAGEVENILEVDRNNAGASNFEQDDPITGLTVGDFLFVKWNLLLNDGAHRVYLQEGAQGQQNPSDVWSHTAEGGTGIKYGVVKITTSSHYLGMRQVTDALDEFQIDYIQAYATGEDSAFPVVENKGEGSPVGGGDDLYTNVDGMVEAPASATNQAPDGWAFTSATPTCYAEVDGSGFTTGVAVFRNGASATNGRMQRAIPCAVGDLVVVWYDIDRSSSSNAHSVAAELKDAIADTGSTVTNNTKGLQMISHIAGETTVNLRFRNSSSSTGWFVIQECSVIVVPAALLT